MTPVGYLRFSSAKFEDKIQDRIRINQVYYLLYTTHYTFCCTQASHRSKSQVPPDTTLQS